MPTMLSQLPSPAAFYDLQEAYRKIKRFQITNRQDLKAGLYVNVRNTLALDNSLVVYIQVNGVPTKRVVGGYQSYVFRSALEIRRTNDPVSDFNPYALRTHRNGREYGGAFVNTLIEHNIAFKHNAKVINFVNRLQAAPRFHQYCIIAGAPFNFDTFDRFHDEFEDATREIWEALR